MNIDIENLHVVPHYDLAEHDTDKNCWCKPVMDDWGIYIHNSLDEREKDEYTNNSIH